MIIISGTTAIIFLWLLSPTLVDQYYLKHGPWYRQCMKNLLPDYKIHSRVKRKHLGYFVAILSSARPPRPDLYCPPACSPWPLSHIFPYTVFSSLSPNSGRWKAKWPLSPQVITSALTDLQSVQTTKTSWSLTPDWCLHRTTMEWPLEWWMNTFISLLN